MKSLKGFVTRDFARKPRSVDEVKRWKATELRHFFLYTGPIVLKGNLPEDKFENFMQLHFVLTILVDDTFVEIQEMVDYAENLLLAFVENARNLYGDWFVVHNVHCLIHLAQNVRVHCKLDNFSSFPFETTIIL